MRFLKNSVAYREPTITYETMNTEQPSYQEFSRYYARTSCVGCRPAACHLSGPSADSYSVGAPPCQVWPFTGQPGWEVHISYLYRISRCAVLEDTGIPYIRQGRYRTPNAPGEAYIVYKTCLNCYYYNRTDVSCIKKSVAEERLTGRTCSVIVSPMACTMTPDTWAEKMNVSNG